jgi:RNA polymerase sigma-70 factor (ECF subfamily)
MSDIDWSSLIAAAAGGDEIAWRSLVERIRPQLREAAARELSRRVRRRVDPSDVVQQSLADAWEDRADFQGVSAAELVAWLLSILKNNLKDAVRRHIKAGKRSIDHERSLDELRSSGAARPDVFVSAELSPQSQLARREALGRLVRLLEDLPPRQRQAVRMRYVERRALKEIAAHLDCNENTAAALIFRGLANLRRRHEQLQSPSR